MRQLVRREQFRIQREPRESRRQGVEVSQLGYQRYNLTLGRQSVIRLMNTITSNHTLALNKSNTGREENPGATRAGSPLEQKRVITVEAAAGRKQPRWPCNGGIWRGRVKGPAPALLTWKVYRPNTHRLIPALESTGNSAISAAQCLGKNSS